MSTRNLWVFCALFVLLFSPEYWAQHMTENGIEFLLADETTPPAPIFLYENAPPRTRDAAVTLADYIEKTCGLRPEILQTTPETIPPRAIWVGYQQKVQNLFPETNFEFEHPEEILIAANENHLVIAGRDRWDPEHMEGWGRLAEITGRQQEYGTANAVYTFIQDYLGVRWLWPGPGGEDILVQKRIAFKPFEYRYHPQIRARAGMLVRLSLGYSKEGASQVWARYQRVQLDSLEVYGNHGFGDWFDKYHAEHPEYFALQPDGTRSGFPGGRYAKLCQSNPAVWQQWISEVEQMLEENPTQRVFNVSPNDGYYSGHCVCENCRAWDHPDGEKVSFHWKGIREQHPALSDRHVTFANNLARLLKERYPDKEYYVQLHAYGLSRPAPVEAVPDDNVIITSVSNFHMRGDGMRVQREKSMEQFDQWSKSAPHLAWRPNLGNPVGLKWGMPDIALKQAAEDFRFVAERNCLGLFFDHFQIHFSTQGPHYYLLAHLAWNPYINTESLMEDYYQRGFGPAAAEIKAYWELLEKTRMEYVQEVPNSLRAFSLPEKYTPELMEYLNTLLQEAELKTEGQPEYQNRVAYVRDGFELTNHIVETRRLMILYEAGDKSVAEKVHEHFKAVEEMKKRMPEGSIAIWSVFRADKPTMGMHPDNPLSGRTLRKFNTANNE